MPNTPHKFNIINAMARAASGLAIAAGAGLVPSEYAVGQDAQPRLLPAPLRELVRFTIAEIRIEGNTLLPGDELLAAVQPFLGSGRRPEDIEGARRAILDAYRGKGHELLSVDYLAARSREGIHYFAVREVRVGRVVVSGNQTLSQAGIRAQLPGLREGETPRMPQLARELFLFNDNPGRRATLEYVPGGPGLTDVTVKVEEAPQTRAAAYINNTGTPATGNTRAGIQALHTDLFGLGHQVGGAFTTSPERPSRVFQVGASYVLPLPSLGDSVSFSASYSDVDSGRIADIVNVSGKGSAFGVRYLRNLARDASARHVLEVGYDERRYRDVVDFFGTNLGASVTAKPLSIAYRYSATAGSTSYSAGAAIQRNLPGGKFNDDASYAFARAGADARWKSVVLEAGWHHETKGGWGGAVRGAAQLADEPLIAGEQFGLGGARTVRGFYEREGAGDRGVRGSVELYAPRLAQSHRLLAFFDFGRSTRIDALPGERTSERVGSVGFGWRAQPGRPWSLSADLAYVTEGTSTHRNGDTMLHISAVYSF